MKKHSLSISLVVQTLGPTLAVALALAGCGQGDSADAAPPSGGPGATGVGQAGSQDFGLFRQILENGEIPSPGVLDALGFFAEHKLDYPAPECGDDLCMHGLVGAMGNMINGADCTILQLGMNSPVVVDPENRPPMDLVLSVDTSGSMAGDPISFLRDGLAAMVDELRAGDTVTLVTYSSEARVVFEGVSASNTETLRAGFAAIAAGGNTNLYDGLFTALRLAEQRVETGRQSRVVFLSDGLATTGLQDPARIRSLAEAYARLGVAITTIGVGQDFDLDIMRGLGQVGSGNFYFLADPADVVEVFRDEVRTFLFPVALDVVVNVAVESTYKLRAGYGAREYKTLEGGASLRIPALYLAGRTSADEPVEEGRRGGGGAVIFELVADALGDSRTDIGSVTMNYTDPVTGERKTQVVSVGAPHRPGQAPPEGYFSSATSEKAFVMLNIFAGFRMAAELARDADPRSAAATLYALRDSVADWLADPRRGDGDPDIQDDLRYVDLFIENLERVIATSPDYPTPPAPDPWPAD